MYKENLTFKVSLSLPVHHEHINSVKHRTVRTHKAAVSTVGGITHSLVNGSDTDFFLQAKQPGITFRFSSE